MGGYLCKDPKNVYSWLNGHEGVRSVVGLCDLGQFSDSIGADCFPW